MSVLIHVCVWSWWSDRWDPAGTPFLIHVRVWSWWYDHWVQLGLPFWYMYVYDHDDLIAGIQLGLPFWYMYVYDHDDLIAGIQLGLPFWYMYVYDHDDVIAGFQLGLPFDVLISNVTHQSVVCCQIIVQYSFQDSTLSSESQCRPVAIKSHVYHCKGPFILAVLSLGANATSLSDELTENPIWCSLWTATNIKRKFRFRSVDINEQCLVL